MITRNSTMTRTEVINALIQKNNYKNYLEIGCQNDVNYNLIICDNKVGVDPEMGGTLRMTSDDFFYKNKEEFDIIFIDGLHERKQVFSDIINSLFWLKDGGTIICHDMIPSSEEAQRVPRETKHWNGDCWKAFIDVRMERPDVDMKVIQTDCGLGIIKKIEYPKNFKEWIKLDESEITYANFEKNQKEWLNAITVEEFKELYL